MACHADISNPAQGKKAKAQKKAKKLKNKEAKKYHLADGIQENEDTITNNKNTITVARFELSGIELAGVLGEAKAFPPERRRRQSRTKLLYWEEEESLVSVKIILTVAITLLAAVAMIYLGLFWVSLKAKFGYNVKK
ncbi:hypothetical protein EJ08DRAFT_88628 [Tothia fuscella]|uniref:Uncharacterized protein n=1 Tax=Tothia fuscella TaxID=1048955 RepID=A0A9P4NVJ5_9PEZI|nr:hypothetical protein EJ08DRAFT_88628 [Tothia fuscella]